MLSISYYFFIVLSCYKSSRFVCSIFCWFRKTRWDGEAWGRLREHSQRPRRVEGHLVRWCRIQASGTELKIRGSRTLSSIFGPAQSALGLHPSSVNASSETAVYWSSVSSRCMFSRLQLGVGAIEISGNFSPRYMDIYIYRLDSDMKYIPWHSIYSGM